MHISCLEIVFNYVTGFNDSVVSPWKEME